MTTQRLFSYGTLRLESVQRAQFGRLLAGDADAMIGWRREEIEITDPAVLAVSRERFHPIVRRSDDPGDTVPGVVFAVSDADLRKADAYEVDDYVRIETTLASGRVAWVYVAP